MMRKTARTTLGLALAAALANGAAADLDTVDPASIGLDPAKLEEVRAALKAEIEGSEAPGAVMLIARKGEVGFYASAGQLGPDDATPVDENTIFRIYSMTKPIVTIAAMSMVEDGSLKLDEPISTYVPVFADVKVLDPETGGVRAPKRPITVRDLMRHTSGMIYGILAPDTPLGKIYLENGIASSDIDLDELSARLAKLPLMTDPGGAWLYGRSTDVLGDVMEAAAGEPLDKILQDRVLGPLGMTDTAFYREADVASRVAQPPQPLFSVTDPKPMLSGGGGLTSTLADYLKFALMLRNRGELNGTRIVSAETLDEMTKDQLGDASREYFYPGDAYTFGLGFAVRRTEDGPYPGSVGDYWWRGVAGTYFWVDPKKDLFAIFMVQSPAQRTHFTQKTREWVYGALTD